jgi:DNA-binding GntR family transcriptional regulator
MTPDLHGSDGDVPPSPSPDGKIRALSIATQVYETLRRRITENLLDEQQPLVISALVKEFGVSHTPVREALARLHAEGLATFTENIGYRVTPRPTAADYSHWMQARLTLEVGAMRHIAPPISVADIERLSSINDAIAGQGFGANFESARRFSELNRAFHRELILLCKNPFLAKAYDRIWLGAQFSRIHAQRGVLNQQTIVEEHRVIVNALRDGLIGQAADLLARHIVESLDRDVRQQSS